MTFIIWSRCNILYILRDSSHKMLLGWKKWITQLKEETLFQVKINIKYSSFVELIKMSSSAVTDTKTFRVYPRAICMIFLNNLNKISSAGEKSDRFRFSISYCIEFIPRALAAFRHSVLRTPTRKTLLFLFSTF